MKILPDERVPWPIHRLFTGHECTTAQRRGRGGIKNGDLLRPAETEFDLFITSDQNIRHQRNLAGRQIAILEPTRNDLRRILAASDRVLASIVGMRPGQLMTPEIP